MTFVPYLDKVCNEIVLINEKKSLLEAHVLVCPGAKSPESNIQKLIAFYDERLVFLTAQFEYYCLNDEDVSQWINSETTKTTKNS